MLRPSTPSCLVTSAVMSLLCISLPLLFSLLLLRLTLLSPMLSLLQVEQRVVALRKQLAQAQQEQKDLNDQVGFCKGQQCDL